MRPPLRPFTTAFIVICVLVAMADFFLRGRLLTQGLLFGPAVADREWWRVLGTAFLHANLFHLAMNMFATFDLGGKLEGAIGWWRMAIISLVTALGASSFVLLFSYYQGTVGASGVICGFLGTMLPLATREGRRLLTSMVLQISIISLIPGISWQGHLGGFLFGLLCGGALRLRGKAFLLPGAGLVIFALAAVLVGALFGPTISSVPVRGP